MSNVKNSSDENVKNNAIVVAMLGELARRTARIISQWQLVGFIHGVMNTDNMSFIGVTIDYGPFAFMEAFDPSFTPNITDLQANRRYCYDNQPSIGLWNVQKLLESFVTVNCINEEEKRSIEEEYRTAVRKYYWDGVRKKLGFEILSHDQTDETRSDGYDQQEVVEVLHRQLMSLMKAFKADFTLTFRFLSKVRAAVKDEGVQKRREAAEKDLESMKEYGVFEALNSGEFDDKEKVSEMDNAFISWLADYKDALAECDLLWMNKDDIVIDSHEKCAAIRKSSMDSVNPLYVPRNYILQQCIEEAEAGNYQKLHELLRVLQSPFERSRHENMDDSSSCFTRDLALPAPVSLSRKPGIAILS